MDKLGVYGARAGWRCLSLARRVVGGRFLCRSASILYTGSSLSQATSYSYLRFGGFGILDHHRRGARSGRGRAQGRLPQSVHPLHLQVLPRASGSGWVKPRAARLGLAGPLEEAIDPAPKSQPDPRGAGKLLLTPGHPSLLCVSCMHIYKYSTLFLASFRSGCAIDL